MGIDGELCLKRTMKQHGYVLKIPLPVGDFVQGGGEPFKS